MKKPYYFAASFLLTGMLAAGCGNDENEQPVLDTETDTIEENARDLPSKIQNVQSTLIELNTHIDSSEGSEDIQKTGKSLEEHWDLAEAEIEEQYPEDYAAIEESLYPLIDETKKDSPDTEKMKPLAEDSNDKLTSLLEKATEPKKEKNEVELDLDQGNK
jgi:iron uptake system EfeUOB component EfeO/EfeM